MNAKIWWFTNIRFQIQSLKKDQGYIFNSLKKNCFTSFVEIFFAPINSHFEFFQLIMSPSVDSSQPGGSFQKKRIIMKYCYFQLKYRIHCYRFTHKRWDFIDDRTECNYSCLITFMVSCGDNPVNFFFYFFRYISLIPISFQHRVAKI